MLLEEYDRWLVGTVLLVLVVGIVDAVGPHWVATGVVWLAFLPAIALAAHAAVRPRRRLAIAHQAVDVAESEAGSDAAAPVLTFQAPRMELRDPSGRHRSSGVALCASITNRSATGPGVKALDAEPLITWTTSDVDRAHGPIDGRWRGVPLRRLDLLPNGLPYLIELAFESPGEDGYQVAGRERSYWVRDGSAQVTVEVRGANFAPVSATYTVWSDSDGGPALRHSEGP